MSAKNERIKTIIIPGFKGGRNTSLPAHEIRDDELAELINFEFDKESNLITRLGTELINTVTTFASRITSLHQLRLSSGTNIEITTSGNEIYKNDGGGTFTSIKGLLTLPTNTKWQWRTFNDLAIGVNSGGALDNTAVKWGGSGDAAALGGSPPSETRYIEVWNKRVWIATKTTLYWSALGNPEDWTGRGSGSIEPNVKDGDEITGIYAHKGFLFVFKRDHIYRIQVGVPNTDPDQWSVELVNAQLGCIASHTIQAVFDDVLFLSRYGVASLRAASSIGDFESCTVSHKIPELAGLNESLDTYDSVVDRAKGQYWLAVPSVTSGNDNGTVHVLAFDCQDRELKWTTFEGAVVGATYANVLESGRLRTWIGGYNKIYRHKFVTHANPYSDNAVEYSKRILTKSFTFEDALRRKEFLRWGIELGVETDPTSVIVNLRFNGNDRNDYKYSVLFTDISDDAEWDDAEWDDALWASEADTDTDIVRKVQGAKGRKHKSMQLLISNAQVDQALSIKSMFVEAKELTRRRVSNV